MPSPPTQASSVPALTHTDLYREVTGPQTAPQAAPQAGPQVGSQQPSEAHRRTDILLLHGWGSSAALMRPIADWLKLEYRVFNVDLPGHGHSPLPPVAMDVPQHAELIAEFIRANMGHRPVTIIGHSNGGRIGLFMASHPNYKALIQQLILISPSGITPERPPSYHLKRTIARVARWPARLMPRSLAQLYHDWLSHSLLWRALGSSDYNAASGVMKETFVQTVSFHVDDVLDQIECPVLLIWGDQDTAVRRSQIDALERSIKDCGVLVLNGAGHYGHLDAPAEVEAACRSMLRALHVQPPERAETV